MPVPELTLNNSGMFGLIKESSVDMLSRRKRDKIGETILRAAAKKIGMVSAMSSRSNYGAKSTSVEFVTRGMLERNCLFASRLGNTTRWFLASTMKKATKFRPRPDRKTRNRRKVHLANRMLLSSEPMQFVGLGSSSISRARPCG